MPGSQELHLGTMANDYSLHVKVRPKSQWRYLPLIGPLMLFRLGANVQFHVNLRWTRADYDDRDSDLPWEALAGRSERLRLILFMNGEPQGTKIEYFVAPDTLDSKVYFDLDAFFFAFTGDAQLRMSSGDGPDRSCYAFRVWDPGLSVVNWTMAGFAGVIGGVIVWALGKL